MTTQYPERPLLPAPPPPGAILILACGNDLRGDDALGARFVAEIERQKQTLPPAWRDAIVTHWQLQWGPETALLLANRHTVCFVDAYAPNGIEASPHGAERAAAPPFVVTRLEPPDGTLAPLLASVGTHQVSPIALLAAARLLGLALPASLWQIAIRGEHFTLGAPLSALASRALAETLTWFWPWLVGETPICTNGTITLN
ncbi:hypothetical protein [Hydrogenophilus thermoluteolus]|jgi:hydrogenase maturation protease|uniref:HoxW n=1 Tax=Hydrogenophilus thermoluteolus TaxID=297 RepID=A0A288Y8U8_HYDTE|nr:hypothetical protein [Hydrogenophilus thermoluteolus]HCO76649.1 hypothetical protein [Rhodocyclaceae bacterium]AST15079.1 HoxW [Hydrogenophilus thermoluteolus]MBW7656022.1 hypothetical protein [Hydrogenophilus thermoluteolus]BBD77686.1 hydrogenase maturation factor [Hydrogenophilus thermoluteolus]HNQ48976.1 hypothetical protein [Hydrogenophilus thermoluteolus]